MNFNRWKNEFEFGTIFDRVKTKMHAINKIKCHRNYSFSPNEKFPHRRLISFKKRHFTHLDESIAAVTSESNASGYRI